VAVATVQGEEEDLGTKDEIWGLKREENFLEEAGELGQGVDMPAGPVHSSVGW